MPSSFAAVLPRHGPPDCLQTTQLATPVQVIVLNESDDDDDDEDVGVDDEDLYDSEEEDVENVPYYGKRCRWNFLFA